MPSRIDIRAPATLTVLAGSTAVSSLDQLPPGGLTITDPNAGGTITVQLIAVNAGAMLTVSGGGATITANGNTLSLTGSMAQINAALAALVIAEPTGVTTDTIRLTARDTAALSGTTAIAVDVVANARPAFASPPANLAVAQATLIALPGLAAGDPGATGYALAGEGAAQDLVMTLAAASGLLFLPGYSALDGIAATGLGTGTIHLSFSADRLAAVNSLIAGLEIAAPSGVTGLAYALRDASDATRVSVTSGNIALTISGTAAPSGSFAAGGGQSVIRGAESLGLGQAITIAATTGDLGGITGAGALFIAPDATLELPYNGLTLGGSSFDFGTLGGASFAENGALLLAEGATFAQSIAFGTLGLLDFNGALIAGNSAANLDQLSITLQPGATLTGGGVITAGNFSESGFITGAGTIIAEGGETLTVDAGSIGGGAVVEAAAGGVLVLGPDDALQGIFLDTSLTVDTSVTLSFTGAPGLTPITGGFADSLDSSGGVFVITGPQVFNGTVIGFEPGDRLIFPGLSDVSLFNITNNSFSVAGDDTSGDTVTYLIDAPHPAGTAPFATTDAAGDTEVGLRGSGVEVFLAGNTIAAEAIQTSPNVAQPIQGLAILDTATSTLSFTVTLTVGHGTLAAGTLAPAATLTLVAANQTALNNELAGLSYTGSGAGDLLTISANTGPLAGLTATTHIYATAATTLSAFGALPSAADTVDLANASTLVDVEAAAPGQVIVGANADFADPLIIAGLSGTALIVDGGAIAAFDAAASVTTGANVLVGNGGGAGTLAVITDQFTIGGNLVAGGANAAGGDMVYVPGALDVTGALQLGAGAAAILDLDGTLAAGAVSLAAAGSLVAYNGAVAAFGNLTDNGTLTMIGQASATAGTINLAGTLSLGGTARLADSGGFAAGAGANVQIGPDALLAAAALAQSGGVITAAGTINLSAALSLGGAATLSLAGGTITAAAITVGAGATLTGHGILAPLGAITNKGTIIAGAGTLTLGNDVTNSGGITIGTSAGLDLVHAVSGGTIAFSGTGAALTINDLGLFTAAVAGFTGHDVIDLVGIAPSLVGTASGSITATDTASNKIGGFALGTVSGQPAVTIVSDGFGGALVTLGDEMPCFARGTRLLTPTGYRPIETLKPGDALITAAGDRRAIRWIGSRTLDFAQGAAAAALPVLFSPNALGPGRPARPVRLSPLHAVAIEGVLVPAGHLVNGATILRESARAAVTYVHVELERHDIVLADGLPCETYLDTGNRGALYREAGRRSPAGASCAPLITAGPKLAAIRRRLHAVALAAGFSLTYQPTLRAVTNDRTAVPEIRMKAGRRVARFTLPPGARDITLLSRGFSPAETDPESEDRRQLALCLATARAGQGAEIPRLGAGWLPRAAADQGVWMGARSELILDRPAATLTLTLAAVVQSWQLPVVSPQSPVGRAGW